MTMAILVITHIQPELLRRLAAYFSGIDARIYVHVDKKVDITSFASETRDMLNVRFVAARVDVTWGCCSTLEAIMRTIELSLKDSDCSSFMHLSGSCFPVQPPRNFIKFAAGRLDCEYISIGGSLESAGADPKLGFIEDYNFRDTALFRFAAKRQSFTGRKLKGGLNRLANYLNKFAPKRSFPAGLKPHYGSSSWLLSRDCISYLHNVWSERQDVRAFFRYCLMPEEIYFHSVLMSSAFATRISDTSLDRMTQRKAYGVTYIDWSEGGDHPKTLDISDLEEIARSNALIGRKFLLPTSDELLDKMLEQHALR
jgi:hypothetical protein